MGKYFGTDGFRGEANVTLLPEHAYKTGRYLGWYFGNICGRPKVAVGTDTRLSSRMFEEALTAGLLASGADVFLMHVVTTPNVSYISNADNMACGVMITASHNKFSDNGIKIIDGNGRKISSEIEEKIEKYIDGNPSELPYALGADIGRAVEYPEGRIKYIEYLKSLAKVSFEGYRIGLDMANGASAHTAKEIFSSLGAEVYSIGDKPDGVNINDAVGSTHPEKLQKLVSDNNLYAGFAFDGDADRCLAADEHGNLLDGDAIMYICGKYLKSRGELTKDTVTATVMSNMGLEKALALSGISLIKTDVGDKYVSTCMKEHGYALGGEQSGHIIFGKYSATGDGILTAIMIMNASLEAKTNLSVLKEGFVVYPQYLKNIEVKDKNAALENPRVSACAAEVRKELGTDGRLLLRKSGTESLIRVMVEAKTDELCKKYVNIVVSLIEKEKL